MRKTTPNFTYRALMGYEPVNTPEIFTIEVPDKLYWRAVEDGKFDDSVRARYPEQLVRRLQNKLWQNWRGLI